MLVPQLNAFSLVTPLFMITMGFVISIMPFIKHIPDYLVRYGYSTALAGTALLMYSIILPTEIPRISTIISGLLFFSVALFVQAVSLRLKVKISWLFMLLIIAIGMSITFYFSIIDEQYSYRLSMLAIVPIALFTHNLPALYEAQLKHRLDRLLRVSVVLLIFVVIFRIGYLMFVLEPSNEILANNMLFATLQLLILVLSIALAALLISCAIQDIYQKLKRESRIDPLTGLLNRRAFQEKIQQRQQRSSPSQHAVIVCDIDHFKHINDNYGHKIGDIALKKVADILRKSLRKQDEISRIGGEEFLILLHDIDRDTALLVVERMRHHIEQSVMNIQNQKIKITISFGISFFQDYAQIHESIQHADLLLYQSKRYGRNQVQWQLSP